MTLVEQPQAGSAVGPAASADGYLPAAVLDVEVSRAVPGIAAIGPDGRRRDRAWLLVRIFDEPIGAMTLPLGADGSSAETVAAAVDMRFGAIIRERTAGAGGALPGALPTGGFGTPATPSYLAERAEALRQAPSIDVVVSTRDRPATLSRCVHAVLAQRYPDFRVIIVDNAPSTDETRQWAMRSTDDRVEYVVEPRPLL